MPAPGNHPRADRVLRQHLQTDRLLGIDAVPIAQAPPPEFSPRVSAAQTSGSPTIDAAPRATIPVGDRLAVLQTIDQQQVQGCTDCVLHESRTHTVFGEGAVDADLMIIGEGPGAEEDRTGRPFVGRAGELLNKQINAMGLSREAVYITNVVKCRPPENRTPAPAEARTCHQYLSRQIEIIRPKVILTVGGPATKLLLHTTTNISTLRGIWHTYDAINPPIPLMPTFHPAYLLRAYTNDNRKKVWNDLQLVIEKLARGSRQSTEDTRS